MPAPISHHLSTANGGEKWGLEVKPVPAFKDNYIWLIVNPENRAAAMVDPGDAAPVFEALRAGSLEPVAILATHHHGDHVGGVEPVASRYRIPVFGPARESIPCRTRALCDGDVVEIPELGVEFSIIDIPGHTRGHIAYHGAGMVFCGDTLFMSGCGRLFEGTPAQMHASLARLSALPDGTRVYCGHEYTLANLRFAAEVEPANADIRDRAAASRALRDRGLPTVPGSIEQERRTNPFLRVHVPAVIESASRFAGRPLADPVSTFAAVRQWKDLF